MKRFLEPSIHILIWIILYLIAVIYIKTIGPFNYIDSTIFLPLTVGTSINAIIFYIVSLWIIPKYANRSNYRAFTISILFVIFGFTAFETYIDYSFLLWLFSDSPESFFSMFIMNGVIHLIFASLALGYGFIRSWITNEKKRQSLINEKLRAELNFLKTQLNPHFLFNVLNMAYSSASRKGDEQTADIIEKLSVLMRYMIYESNVDKVEVEREIDFIKNYINLQKMRFSKDLPVTLTYTIDGHFSGQKIAPLILISFIENAFKFGVKLDEKSNISISMNFINGQMEFVCTNQIFRTLSISQKKDSGIGLENTKRRLNILYPSKHKLFINDNGNEFIVKLILNLE